MKKKIAPEYFSTTADSLGRRPFENIEMIVFRSQAALSRWLFRTVWNRAKIVADLGWRSCRGMNQFLRVNIIGRYSGQRPGVPERPAGANERNKNNMTQIKNAPLAPETSNELDSTTTPAIILQGMIGMFIEPGAPPEDREAALELDLLFMLDSTAAEDLIMAIGCRGINVNSPAGMDYMLTRLEKCGAVVVDHKPKTDMEKFGLKFHPGALLQILKAMPHREGGMGLSLDLVGECTETTCN